jgi:hypothetical protein
METLRGENVASTDQLLRKLSLLYEAQEMNWQFWLAYDSLVLTLYVASYLCVMATIQVVL